MKSVRIICISAVLLIFAGRFCPAQDIIKLKNGNEFQGRVTGEVDGMIHIELKPGEEMSFPKSDVAKIVRGKAEPVPAQPPAAPRQQEGQVAAADREKAQAEVLRLTESSRLATRQRNFRQAMGDLDKARELSAKYLYPAKTDEIDREIQLVQDTQRITIQVDVRHLYVPDDYADEAIHERWREMKNEGGAPPDMTRREVFNNVEDSMKGQFTEQLKGALAEQLRRAGYNPVASVEGSGRRTSALYATYDEYGDTGSEYSSPRGPLDAPGSQVSCALRIVAPNGEEVWHGNVSAIAPYGEEGGLAAGQFGRSMFFQRLRQVSFGGGPQSP